MQAIGMIPARLQSSRLPRKLLLAETGKPLIRHTWEAASRAKCLSAVLVATDSAEMNMSMARETMRALPLFLSRVFCSPSRCP